MKHFFVGIAYVLAACSEPGQQAQSMMIRDIEEELELPRGANPLKDYARYYANKEGKIIGVLIDFTDQSNTYYDVPVGETRWLDDYRKLPLVSDGGCSIVNVVYDLASHEIERTFCNEEA